MTEREHAAILAALDRYTAEHTKTREAARAALIREGIYTEDGELREEFGGPAGGRKTKKPRAKKPIAA